MSGGDPIRLLFEARAETLKIPYTNLTETSDLVALVLQAEREGMPPKEDRPDCFGNFWEGPFTSDCHGCEIQSTCFHFLAMRQKSAWLNAQPRDADVVARQLQLKREAILLGFAYVRHISQVGDPSHANEKAPTAPPSPSGTPPPPTQSPPQTFPSSPSRPMFVADVGALGSQKVAAPIAVPAEASVAFSTKSRSKKNPEPPSIPTKGTTKKAASPQTKAAAKTKTTTGSTKASEVKARMSKGTLTSEMPTSKLGPSQGLALPASPKRSRGRSSNPKIPWGEHTHQARWVREREKSAMIRNLKVGSTLSRVYKGQLVTVKVKDGYYLWDNRQFPTLYAVVKAVVGEGEYAKRADKDGNRPEGKRKLSTWSATKFFAHELSLRMPCS
jgi:hypothetical protein